MPVALDRLGDDARRGRAYVEDNTVLRYGDGLLNTAKSGHDNVVFTLTDFLGNIAKYTSAQAGTAVQQTISLYEESDAAAVQRLEDASLGLPFDRSQFEYLYRIAGSSAGFPDVTQPQANFISVRDYNKHEDFQYAPQLWDLASPTSWVRDAIWGATGLGAKLGIFDRAYDPFETWVKPLSGDWIGVRACADVYDNVALSVQDMAANLRRHVLAVNGVWSGTAADAMLWHCWNSADKLMEAAGPLLAVAEQYRTAAEAMFEIGKVMGSLIADLADAAMIFAAEVSLAAAASETIVGGLVFGGAALYEGHKMWDIINECLDLVGRADSLTAHWPRLAATSAWSARSASCRS